MVLDRPLTLRRVVERVVEQQRAGCIPDLFATWQSVCILFELTKRQVYPLRERIKGVQKAGNKVERAEEFERAIREIEELYHDFRTTFPVATEEEAVEDLAAIARGDHVDAEEAFARIAGVDAATWRRRVAAHEADQPSQG
jgi:allophanate hydrolase subunit 1